MNSPTKPNVNKPNKASNCPKAKSNLNNAKYKAIIVGNINNTNIKMLIIILLYFLLFIKGFAIIYSLVMFGL